MIIGRSERKDLWARNVVSYKSSYFVAQISCEDVR